MSLVSIQYAYLCVTARRAVAAMTIEIENGEDTGMMTVVVMMVVVGVATMIVRDIVNGVVALPM